MDASGSGGTSSPDEPGIVIDARMAEAMRALQIIGRLADGESVKVTRTKDYLFFELTKSVFVSTISSFDQFAELDETAMSVDLPDPDRPCPACHSATLQVVAGVDVETVRCFACGVEWRKEADATGSR